MSLYLSWIEGSPPKRNAGGSIPPRDVIWCRNLSISALFSSVIRYKYIDTPASLQRRIYELQICFFDILIVFRLTKSDAALERIKVE